ncbi:hypothetical protein QE385_003305 [Sphingomonas sp. SORGH_AS 950]|uniref:hypothetical protein n=1 Tax=Sphingomonas sp. SORGH_AS_0950 TaxID=3041792 RepID=UPI00278A6C4B|nr:hypothetical protein [Sphingomonas sp. SORGH_AS_0950]MDQ1158978.1 hypothetical protein [Sphingomonas sp. SORGH_AS_0950]
MTLRLTAALLIAVAGPVSAQTPDRTDRNVRAVAVRFQHAIRHRDKAEFLSLFLNPAATNWQEVMSMKALAKDASSKGIKAVYDPGNNPVAFIDSIVARKGNADEDFNDIRIAGDGESAAMSFDYAFRIDGVVLNTGMEHWLLVNTNSGWRIVSVAWSVK